MNQPADSGLNVVPIETAGSAREVAEKVKQGKAFLKIGQTPWGVQFYICERGKSATGSIDGRHESFPPLARLLFASVKAGSRNPHMTTSTLLNLGRCLSPRSPSYAPSRTS